jgi:hypothetical protein
MELIAVNECHVGNAEKKGLNVITPGNSFECDDATGKALLEAGAAKLPPKEESKEPAKKAPAKKAAADA